MSKASIVKDLSGGVSASSEGNNYFSEKLNLSARKTGVCDIQRLRALVNILNMRIELLESELAILRTTSGSHNS